MKTTLAYISRLEDPWISYNFDVFYNRKENSDGSHSNSEEWVRLSKYLTVNTRNISIDELNKTITVEMVILLSELEIKVPEHLKQISSLTLSGYTNEGQTGIAQKYSLLKMQNMGFILTGEKSTPTTRRVVWKYETVE